MKRLITLLKDKQRLHAILFGEDEKWSKKVDVFIFGAVILCLVLESVESVIHVEEYSLETLLAFDLTPKGITKTVIIALEYLLTALFAVEYCLRAYCSTPKREYTMSFFGVIDFVATWPTILSIFFPQLRYFAIFRTFRLIRIFRVFQLFTFINEGYLLLESIKKSMTKILVYFLFVVVLVCILGMLMFIVESDEPGTQFTSIPVSIYWAIVTLTTVGYGDITPITGLGQFLSSMVMILGYTIIAIPTGIVSANIIDATKKKGQNGRCPRCNQKTDLHANYCKHCGEKL
ncbi:MAG: ion transporter [Prevotella sp.]|nr:ion transporter [Candidatus Prevotella equi]